MWIGYFEKWLWNFMGIILESLPFMVIGALISSIIQFYITEDVIKKIIPRNRFIGIIGATLSGLIFPVCECAIVPITRSLIKKGLPLGIGISFMLSVPIVNPLVIMSTYYAFPNNFKIVLIRVVGGVLIALIVGMIIEAIYAKNSSYSVLRDTNYKLSCECCNVDYVLEKGKVSKFKKLVNHASSEFLNISIYFTIGAFLSSLFATFVNNDKFANMSTSKFLSIAIMMFLAFILSLCSEADAFVAKAFISNFGDVAIIAFLILGPMMDLKNAFLTFGLFNKKFTMVLIVVIVTVISIFTMALRLLGV